MMNTKSQKEANMANNQTNEGQTGSPTANQSEGEFFAVVETGRRGVQQALETMNDELMAIAAAPVRQQGETWKARALAYVTSSEPLKPVIKTKRGIWSVYQSLARAAQMGLQIGGQFPHAHLVPKSNLAVLIPTADGYAFEAAHGPGSVLKNIPEIHVVYENDHFRINEAALTFEFDIQPFGERGKIVGYFTKLVYRDGRIEIPYVLRSAVEKIAKEYGNLNSPAYKKSPEDMYKKIAAKKLLKKPAAESEGLAMMYADDEELPAEDPTEYPTPPRNVTERASGVLDNVMDVMGEPDDDEEGGAPDVDESDADTVDDSAAGTTDDPESDLEDKTGDLF